MHRRAVLLAVLPLVAGCASRGGLSPQGPGEIGLASWYGPGFHGRRSANGERFDANGLSAAHRTLGLGTRVRVTNLANGRSVVLRITDRGPYVRGRIIDLSYGAARRLGIVRRGLARVRVEPLDPPARGRAFVTKARPPARPRRGSGSRTTRRPRR